MKLITWNVNGIRAWHKKGMLKVIEKEAPDVLCLQETKAHKDQVGNELIEPFQMKSFWSSAVRKGYSGVATFTKLNHPSHAGIGIDKFDSEGRTVVTQFKDFKLYNVYFPNGGSGPERHQYKQEFLRAIAKKLKSDIEAGVDVVLVGDYNVAPEEIDVYDPIRLSTMSGFLPEEREWFKEFLSLGLVDTFRELNPKTLGVYTWWSMQERARPANRGWRIDHICVTKALFKKVKEVIIYQDQEGSDHCPVGITIEGVE
ncbi:MAG: exodeoxyribonuclease III [Pseudomonadota bacterium]|nr:exodeoxyribonuclease III [Pseudomonadota bacterium]